MARVTSGDKRFNDKQYSDAIKRRISLRRPTPPQRPKLDPNDKSIKRGSKFWNV